MSAPGFGFIGSEPDGRFHFQQLSLRDDVWCRPAVSSNLASPFPSNRDWQLSEVLQDPRISVVWATADANLSTVRKVLEAGKQAMLDLPVTVSRECWQEVIEPRYCSHVFVAALHRWRGPYRGVQREVDSGILGSIAAVRRISRQYVPDCLGHKGDDQASGAHASQANAAYAFERGWFQMLDELLLLVECPVTAVDARSTGSGRVAWITFADGCQAHLEFDRRCLAPLESGWILEGTAGGYAGGRRYRPAPDHELVDVPVEPSHTDQQAFYDALLAAACAGHVFPVTTDSILRVLLLRDAIAESLGAGREVRLTECEF